MTLITIKVPEKQKVEYKKIFSNLVRDYSLEELKEINNTDLINHNLSDLSEENKNAYKNSFNIKKEELINI